MSNFNTAEASGSGTNNPGQPTRSNTTRSIRAGRDFIDRVLDFFHAPPHPQEHPPASPTSSRSSDSDASLPSHLLCAICSRRENKVLYTVCGHRACTSCTKRLWNSMRKLRAGRCYSPRPTCFPCPFCREMVTRVRDDLGADPQSVGVYPVLDSAGAEGEGMRVVEWMLKVSRKTRERLEVDMIKATRA